MPCEPSGLKITMIHVEKAAISAMLERLWASTDTTASGQA